MNRLKAWALAAVMKAWIGRRLLVAFEEWQLSIMLDDRNRVMNEPGATTRFTTDEFEASAAPIRAKQLRIQSLWDTL
jgi:hypothetical protein